MGSPEDTEGCCLGIKLFTDPLSSDAPLNTEAAELQKRHPWDKEVLGNNVEVYMKNYDRWQEEKAAGPQTVL